MTDCPVCGSETKVASERYVGGPYGWNASPWLILECAVGHRVEYDSDRSWRLVARKYNASPVRP